jgi:hypothetical protein
MKRKIPTPRRIIAENLLSEAKAPKAAAKTIIVASSQRCFPKIERIYIFQFGIFAPLLLVPTGLTLLILNVTNGRNKPTTNYINSSGLSN